MGLIDLLKRPSEQEVSETVDVLLAALQEGDIKIPYTLLGRWIVPVEYLPENLRHLNAKTAKHALDQLRREGLVDRYRHERVYCRPDDVKEHIFVITAAGYAPQKAAQMKSPAGEKK